MAITAELVNQAATEIAENGKNPTVALVRAHLGTGSYSTITPLFREWLESQAPPSVLATAAEPAPQQLVDCLLSMAPQIWTIAAGVANVHLTNERNAIDIERTELQSALADSDATGDIISADLDVAQALIIDLTAEMAQIATTHAVELADQNNARIASDQAVAVLNATNGQLQTRLDDQIVTNHELKSDFDSSKTQISTLTDEISSIAAGNVIALAEQVNARIAVEKDLAVLDATNSQLQSRLDDQREITHNLKTDLDNSLAQVVVLTAEVARITAAHVVDLAKQSNARIAAEQAVSVLNATNGQLQLRLDDQRDHNADLKVTVDNLTSDLISMNNGK